MSKLTQIKATNFRGFAVVDAAPTATIFEISGKNGTGKSNVVSLVEAVIDPRSIEGDPISYGRKDASAMFTMELPSGAVMRAERTWRETKSGNRSTEIQVLEINGNDTTVLDPKVALSTLLGPFQRIDRILDIKTPAQCRELADALLAGGGVDVAAFDKAIESATVARTETARDAKLAAAKLKGMERPMKGLPAEEISVATRAAEIDAMRQQQAAHARASSDVDKVRGLYTATKAEVDRLTAKLAELAEQGKAAAAVLAALPAAPTDEQISTAQLDMEGLEETNAAVVAARLYKATEKEVEETEERAAVAAETLDKARAAKLASLKVCPMPSPDLSIDEENLVTYQGVGLHELSHGQRHVVGVAVALETMGDLNAIFFDGAECLDEDAEEKCKAMCEAHDPPTLLVIGRTTRTGGTITITGATDWRAERSEE